jgi:hypothetical protein
VELKDKTLKDIEGFFEKKSSSIESICFFMQKIRLLLEIDNTKEKYKILNHYCNWLFHKNLDRGISPFIIEEISASFENAKSNNDCIKKISNALSVKKLVVELKETLYKNIGFKYDYIFEHDEFWINFITIVLNELKSRPLLLNERKLIKNKQIEGFGFDFSVYGIQLTHQKSKIVIEILSEELDNQKKHIYIDFALYNEK